MSKEGEGMYVDPEAMWDVDGLPEEYKLFTATVADAATEIVKRNPLLQGALAEDGLSIEEGSFLQESHRLAAQTGARVAVATLVEAGILGPEVAERIRTGNQTDGPTGPVIFSTPDDIYVTIWGIEERTNKPVDSK